jgi:hypothetical protein
LQSKLISLPAAWGQIAYRVSGKTEIGAAIFVIVPTVDEVEVKLREYQKTASLTFPSKI